MSYDYDMQEGEEGARRIYEERCRQIQQEGWTSDDDDRLANGELAWAAACYAAPQRIFTPDKRKFGPHDESLTFRDPWPQQIRDMDKRPDSKRKLSRRQRIRALEKAGALIAAEIDRLLRLTDSEKSEESPRLP